MGEGEEQEEGEGGGGVERESGDEERGILEMWSDSSGDIPSPHDPRSRPDEPVQASLPSTKTSRPCTRSTATRVSSRLGSLATR